MKKISVSILMVLPISLLSVAEVLGAESDCQSFRIQGNNLLIEDNSSRLKSGSLASLGGEISRGEIVVIDFPKSEICILDKSEPTVAGGALVVNPELGELAITASIDGSYDLLLRLDLDFESELLIERVVGEDIGLTEMEFLSDNSGVGAEDFFAEEIGFLDVGGTELDSLFAEVPRYGISYNHYAGDDAATIDESNKTKGSLGLAVLRDIVLSLDFQGKVFAISKP